MPLCSIPEYKKIYQNHKQNTFCAQALEMFKMVDLQNEINDDEESQLKYEIPQYNSDIPVELVKCGNPNCGKLENKKHEFKKCARCKSISYCSKECQVADWKTHKKICKQHDNTT